LTADNSVVPYSNAKDMRVTQDLSSFGFVPMNADHNVVKKSFGSMIADHDLVKKR
jgi:hypothetical protein